MSPHQNRMQETVQRAAIHEQYPQLAAGHDEMWDRDGNRPRPSWQSLLTAWQSQGSNATEMRTQEMQRALRNNGVSYTVHGDPDGMHRPWQLDPVPIQVDPHQWQTLETGLSQRAELLNLILRDLYGPRTLLRNRLLPPELVYSHSGFLRPCDGILLHGHHQLLFYAADIARGTDGEFWVISDRTQAPSGAGYALENRQCMSRAFPNLMRAAPPRRLQGFYQQLQELPVQILDHASPDPLIVLLTPGPRNETYFEHAYLAAHLGYTLVQGGDLTTRDGFVWLKTLSGLKRVDAILRRVDDPWCDPLELRGDSMLGVPGLVEAARRGNVLIANPLGSSLLENPGMFPFLNRICQQFLGEDLQLPNAATWWCGHPQERAHVLANLEKMVIKPIYNQAQTIFGFQLSRAQLDHWRRRILCHPHHYVGQEHVGFSTTPTLIDGQLVPRPMVMRTFLSAVNAGYRMMPGGLGLVSREPEAPNINSRSGGISKDIWVPADTLEAIERVAPAPSLTVSARSDTESLPSRAGENLYWVGRYAERAEVIVRLIRAVLQHSDAGEDYTPEPERIAQWRMMELLARTTGLSSDDPDPEETMTAQALAWRNVHEGPLCAILQNIGHASFAIRDLWSVDTWHALGEIERLRTQLNGCHRNVTIARLLRLLDRLITALTALSGLTAESMTHEHGWQLLYIGRRLERGMQISYQVRDILGTVSRPGIEQILMEGLLSCNESLITHRRRYRAAISAESVLHLLLLDSSNPRALAYQTEGILQVINNLPLRSLPGRLDPIEKLVQQLVTRIRIADAEGLAAIDPDHPDVRYVDSFMEQVSESLEGISNALTERLFAHASPVRQLSGRCPESRP